MKLKFLGTRGEIDLRTRLHRMHSSLEVSYRGTAVMIDCGADWLHRIRRMRPQAIVLTHAHPDHAWGLKDGAPCPVLATRPTWRSLGESPLLDRGVVVPLTPFHIGGISLLAFPVQHSTRAPAVGYRIAAGRSTIFYAPDLVYILNEKKALSGIQIYVGDGASLRRPIVRNISGALVGHAAIRTQLGWCRRRGVRRALFTHCGSQIVGANSRMVHREVREMGLERHVEARIVGDGFQMLLP